jgi:hypothetical protein
VLTPKALIPREKYGRGREQAAEMISELILFYFLLV